MRTKTKVRILLSFIIIGASMALLLSFGIGAATPSTETSVSALQQEPLPASPEPTVQPTPQPEPTESPKAEPITVWPLILVNSENRIPENYEFDPAFYDTESVDARIYDSMVSMLKAAEADGLNLWLASSFRDVETQEIILERAVENRMADYGMNEDEAREDALKTIAVPGYSEHHTGLAIDFNTVSAAFEETAEYQWLKENAAQYGFVQRYPSGKEEITGIDFEPWHYRYVGSEHASRMTELNLCLEEYTVYLTNR